MANTLTTSEVKARFDEAGLSIAEWARVNQFSAPLVYHVLSGKTKATRGQSHRIAVALNLKKGSGCGALRLDFSTGG